MLKSVSKIITAIQQKIRKDKKSVGKNNLGKRGPLELPVPINFSSPMSTIGRFEGAILGTSWGVVNARTGLESAICLAIS